MLRLGRRVYRLNDPLHLANLRGNKPSNLTKVGSAGYRIDKSSSGDKMRRGSLTKDKLVANNKIFTCQRMVDSLIFTYHI